MQKQQLKNIYEQVYKQFVNYKPVDSKVGFEQQIIELKLSKEIPKKFEYIYSSEIEATITEDEKKYSNIREILIARGYLKANQDLRDLYDQDLLMLINSYLDKLTHKLTVSEFMNVFNVDVNDSDNILLAQKLLAKNSFITAYENHDEHQMLYMLNINHQLAVDFVKEKIDQKDTCDCLRTAILKSSNEFAKQLYIASFSKDITCLRLIEDLFLERSISIRKAMLCSPEVMSAMCKYVLDNELYANPDFLEMIDSRIAKYITFESIDFEYRFYSQGLEFFQDVNNLSLYLRVKPVYSNCTLTLFIKHGSEQVRTEILKLIDNNILNDYPINLTDLATKDDIEFLSQVCNLIIDTKQHWNREVLSNIYLVERIYSAEFFLEIFNFVCEYVDDSKAAIRKLLTSEYSDERCNIINTKYFEGVFDCITELIDTNQDMDKRYINFYLSQHTNEIKSPLKIEWLINNYPKYLNHMQNYKQILHIQNQKKFEYSYLINYSYLDSAKERSEQIVINGYITNFEQLSDKIKDNLIDSLSLASVISYAYDLPTNPWQDVDNLSVKDRCFIISNHYQTYLQLLSKYTTDYKKLERQLKVITKNNVSQAVAVCELLVINLKLMKTKDVKKFLKNTLNLKSVEFKTIRSKLFGLLSQTQQLDIFEYGLSSSKDILVEHTLLLLIDYPQFNKQLSKELEQLFKRNRTIDLYLTTLEESKDESEIINPYPELVKILDTEQSPKQVYTGTKNNDIKSTNNKKFRLDCNSIFTLSDNQYIELYTEIYAKLNEITKNLDEGLITAFNVQGSVYSQIINNKKSFKPIIQYIKSELIETGLVYDYMVFSDCLILQLIEHSFTEEQQQVLQDYLSQICYYLIPKNLLILSDGIALLNLIELGVNLHGSNCTVVIDYYNLEIGSMPFLEYVTNLKKLRLDNEIEKYVYFKLLRDVSDNKISVEQVIKFYQVREKNVQYQVIPQNITGLYMTETQKEINQLVHDKMVDMTISDLGKNDKYQRLKIFGINNLAKMLKATKIDKGFNSSWTANYIANANIKGTTNEQFKQSMDTLGLSKIELVDLAIYNVDLISYVTDYLNEPMIESLVLFFVAHDHSHYYSKDINAKIERMTTITKEEIASGRVCYEWYMDIESAVGKEFINEIRSRMYNTRGAKVIDGLTGNIDKEIALQKIINKRNKDMLLAYSLIEPDKDFERDLLERAKQIRLFKQQSKQFGAQRRSSEQQLADACIKNLGDVFGLSETLNLEIFKLEYQEHQQYFEGIIVDGYTVKLESSVKGFKLQASKDGQVLKTIPAKIKKELTEFKHVQKELNTSYKAFSQSFEQLMITQSEIAVDNVIKFAENPLISQFFTNLIFEAAENKFVMYYDNSFRDEQLERVELKGDMLKVAHITSIINNDKYFEWKQVILSNHIVQPFKQLFREAYFKQSEELEDSNTYRYGNHMIKVNTAFSLLISVGWSKDYDGLYKLFPQCSIRVELWGFNSWYYESFKQENSLEEIRFFNLKTNKEILIKDVDDVVFSEVMRDFDLAVSVAHIGEENREIGLSTVEIRKEILEVNQKLFKLSNLKVEGHKVLITGTLGNYVVNLKSGESFKEGRGQLILFPITVKRKKDVYLPYLDKNSKTQEIMSLIILLSRDDKISNQKVLKEVMR